MKISVIGLGKLGSSMMAAFASKGQDVIGVDIDPRVIADINSGRAPVIEPMLDELISEFGSRIIATSSYQEAIEKTDLTFIVVPTPSSTDGSYLLDVLRSSVCQVAHAISRKNRYHLIVLSSTVQPCTCALEILPLIEEFSGKKCGEDFGFCYSPEFIALGSVISDFLNPSFVLIGQSDQAAGDRLEAFYREVLPDSVEFRRMSIINAELTKMALNSFLTIKISFANMISSLAEKVSGANCDEICKTIGLDRRIGASLLNGGLGYGGPCLPRDNQALCSFAARNGVAMKLSEAADIINNDVIARVIEQVKTNAKRGETIALFGIGYKQGTTEMSDSQSLRIGGILSDLGAKVVAYDPLISKYLPEVKLKGVKLLPDAESCLKLSNVIIIASTDKEFASINFAQHRLVEDFSQMFILDCWRTVPPQNRNATWIQYKALGLGEK